MDADAPGPPTPRALPRRNGSGVSNPLTAAEISALRGR
eukprot:gene11792-20696_t